MKSLCSQWGTLAGNGLKKMLSTGDTLKKEVIMAGNVNMNLLDFEQNKKVQKFFNTKFGHNMMSIINKQTNTRY